MSLDLSPESETIVREYAEREGIPIDELMRRTFGKARPPIATPDSDKERVFALMQKWQKEYGMPSNLSGKGHRSLAELSAEWQAEDAELTEAERNADRQFWEERERQYDSRTPISI